jgi:hypothetical protein
MPGAPWQSCTIGGLFDGEYGGTRGHQFTPSGPRSAVASRKRSARAAKASRWAGVMKAAPRTAG